MKKCILILVFFFIGFSVQSQTRKTKSMLEEIQGQWQIDENQNIFYQKVIILPGAKKDVLFQRAENYFIYNYNSGKDVIQTKDKEQGLIIGKGYWPKVYTGITLGTFVYNANHILRIDVKDDKARLTLTIQGYDMEFWDTNGRMTRFDKIMASVYPINEKSSSKTMEGKAFFALHNKCQISLDAIAESLKNDVVQKVKNDNW